MQILFLVLALLSTIATAHEGRTAKATGCHNDRSKQEYHCHKGPLEEQVFKNKQEALDALAKITVKPTSNSELHSPNKQSGSLHQSYNRKDWPHWVDEDHDCQNTRSEILQRDNVGTIKWKRNKPCNVSWGRWVDPYSGKTFDKASDLDIDHIVPLKHAYTYGAKNWTKKQRRDFANDPENLLVVSAELNRQKGAKGPTRWMPPRKEYWCEYTKKWVHVKSKYRLEIGPREQAKLNQVQVACVAQ